MPTQLKTSIEAVTPPAAEQPAHRPRTPRDAFEEASAMHVGLYSRTVALRELIAEAERTVTQSFVIDHGGADGHVENAKAAVWRFCDGEAINRLSSMKTLLAMIEESSDFKTAETVVRPLLADLRKYEAEQEAERVAAGERAAKLAAALEIAKTKALEAAEHDPDVVAARRALEK